MNRTPPLLPRAAARPPTRPASRRLALLAAPAAVALALAFAAGRWSTGDEPRPAAGDRGAAPLRAAPGRVSPVERTLAGGIAFAPPPAPVVAAAVPAAPASPARGVPREIVARVAAEASLGLERARQDLVARCVPGNASAGGPGAKLTFNVTFDASGREIARGISEDRRHRAPEIASCLRRLPLGSLRVSAPGANVGVRVSMNLP
jgi:hypothetical protein